MTGGAGSSVLSQNVAHELSEIYDEQVMVLDMDISYGTAALDYNQQPRQTIVDALTQTATLDAATLNQFFQEYGDTKLSVLGSPASLSTGLQITSQPLEVLMKVVKPMAEFIILDIPHMWDSWINDSLAGADEVVLVCRPDLTNLRNAKNVVEYLGPKRGVGAPTRLIFNKTGEAKKADLSEKDFKDALAIYAPKVERRLTEAATRLKPVSASTVKRAVDKLQKTLQREMKPLFKKIKDSMDSKNVRLDTLENYKREQARCSTW